MNTENHSIYFIYQEAVNRVGNEELLLTWLRDGLLVAEARPYQIVIDNNEEKIAKGEYQEISKGAWHSYLNDEEFTGPPTHKNNSFFHQQDHLGIDDIQVLKSEVNELLSNHISNPVESNVSSPIRPVGRPQNSVLFNYDTVLESILMEHKSLSPSNAENHAEIADLMWAAENWRYVGMTCGHNHKTKPQDKRSVKNWLKKKI